jgi:hypothetical protein
MLGLACGGIPQAAGARKKGGKAGQSEMLQLSSRSRKRR